MKKLILLCVILIFIPFVVGVRINEVMVHSNNVFGGEWVELYSNESVNLSEWIIGDNSDEDDSINVNFNNFSLIVDNDINYNGMFGCNATYEYLNNSNFSCFEVPEIGNGLKDKNDSIYLYNSFNNLISNFSWNYSIKPSGSSFFFNDSLQECNPTPGRENNCSVYEENNEEENDNETGDTDEDDEDEEDEKPETYLEIDWDEDEIFNKGNFSIDVEGYYLDGEYNLKIWIENSDEDVISDRYDEENEEWASGRFYVDEFFDDEGNESEEILLRMRDEDYGDFEICYKLEDVVDEKCEDIEVLEKNETKESEDSEIKKVEELIEKNKEEKNKNELKVTGNVIRLGETNNTESENIKTHENLVYESGIEKIKKYSVFGFALLCLVLCVLVIMKKL